MTRRMMLVLVVMLVVGSVVAVRAQGSVPDLLQKILAAVTAPESSTRFTPPLNTEGGPGEVSCVVANVSAETRVAVIDIVEGGGLAVFGSTPSHGPFVIPAGHTVIVTGTFSGTDIELRCLAAVTDGTRADVRVALTLSTAAGRLAVAGE
jgi:hypothetical protein